MFSSATKNAASMTADLAQNDLENRKQEATKKVENTVENMSEYANKAGKYVRDFVDDAANRIDATNKMVTEEVRTSPIKSVLIASGVGFVLGMLFRGK
jgi:ElaB/YqjD/DUF883 family membrane-anchored ribosome-binding protein